MLWILEDEAQRVLWAQEDEAQRVLWVQDDDTQRLLWAQGVETQRACIDHELSGNARQIFSQLRGYTMELHLPSVMSKQCDEDAPDEPNSFVDGSLSHPTQPNFSRGGSAAWHPGRKLETHQLSEQE